MESEWKHCTIGDAITLQRGFDITRKTQVVGSVPVVSSGGIKSFHAEAKVNAPGVVLGRKGTLGTVFFLDHDFWPHDTTLWVKDFKGNHERFVYYFFRNMSDDLQSLDVGTSNPALNRNHVHPISTKFPALPEQRAIAHILGSLDDRIELNRRMNATLEGMAQALFKSWFVDFDPVIDNALVAGNPIPEELTARAELRRTALNNGTANQETAKQFPDAFVETEDLGWIPAGWSVGSTLEQMRLLSGGTPKTSESTYWNGTINWASAKDVSQCGKAFLITTERTITHEGLNNSSTKIIPQFSTVIVSRGATTGRLTMFGEHIAMNQTCYALQSKSESHFYAYCHTVHFIKTLVQTAHGSVFDTITTNTFQSTPVLLANANSISAFEDAARPYFSKVLTNEHQSCTLTRLRDTLLPKLISGELRIPDAEKLAQKVLS